MNWLTAIIRAIAEALGLWRLSREAKAKEVQLKNEKEFKDREKKQQEISQKDEDERKIAEVVKATDETERQKKLEEIRKIVSA